jgi:hypothetical protein
MDDTPCSMTARFAEVLAPRRRRATAEVKEAAMAVAVERPKAKAVAVDEYATTMPTRTPSKFLL